MQLTPRLYCMIYDPSNLALSPCCWEQLVVRTGSRALGVDVEAGRYEGQ